MLHSYPDEGVLVTARDYNADMLAAIKRAVPKRGGWVASDVAQKLVATLEENDVDLLHGWLAENSRSIMTDYVSRVMTSRPASRPKTAIKSAFNDAVTSPTPAAAVSRWLSSTYAVADDNTRKALGEMTKDDLLYVADRHERRAKENQFEAIFFQVLARRVPKGKVVDDVLSEKQIVNVREGISV
jgi:hypothetical protein